MLIRALLIGFLCAIGATGTLAHSKMAKTVPSEGATVKAGLSAITLGFSKPVRLMLVKVKNTASNSDVKAEFKPASRYKTSFPFTVAPLNTGSHEVSWTAVAKDGHVMKGKLKFNVAK